MNVIIEYFPCDSESKQALIKMIIKRENSMRKRVDMSGLKACSIGSKSNETQTHSDESMMVLSYHINLSIN